MPELTVTQSAKTILADPMKQMFESSSSKTEASSQAISNSTPVSSSTASRIVDVAKNELMVLAITRIFYSVVSSYFGNLISKEESSALILALMKNESNLQVTSGVSSPFGPLGLLQINTSPRADTLTTMMNKFSLKSKGYSFNFVNITDKVRVSLSLEKLDEFFKQLRAGTITAIPSATREEIATVYMPLIAYILFDTIIRIMAQSWTYCSQSGWKYVRPLPDINVNSFYAKWTTKNKAALKERFRGFCHLYSAYHINGAYAFSAKRQVPVAYLDRYEKDYNLAVAIKRELV